MTAVQPMPDGYPQVIPYLRDDGASAAINVQVVRAKERMRMPAPGGRIGHADAANTSKKIETIRSEDEREFPQESVLRVDSRDRVSFRPGSAAGSCFPVSGGAREQAPDRPRTHGDSRSRLGARLCRDQSP